MNEYDFFSQYDVSRESQDKLIAYHKLLFKWQKAINLVGPKTLQDSWERHFADSAQLLELIPPRAKHLIDLGSGAGFPGLVLGAMRPALQVHLVESDERKAQFLRNVSRETSVDAIVHNERIESITIDFTPDVVTARALSELVELLKFCAGWAVDNPDLKLVFLKGRRWEEEIAAAKKSFDFELEDFPSATSEESRILSITGLKVV